MIRPLFVLLTGLVSGEMLCALVMTKWLMIPVLLISAGVIFQVQKTKYSRYAISIYLGMLLGILLFLLASRTDSYETAVKNSKQKGELSGIVENVKEKEESGRVTILLKKTIFTQKAKRIILNKKIWIYAEKAEGLMIYPGDEITCTGELSLPEEPTNPGEFNQKIYARSNGIYYLFFAQNYKLKKRPLHSVRRMAYKVKTSMESVYALVFREKQAGLLCAMVFGDKTRLDDEEKRVYEENGALHLLCTSGMHVSIVGGQYYQFLRKRKRSYLTSCLAGIIILLFYGCMTGLGSSVTRAILMFFVYLGAEWFGTYYDILSSMSLAGILMLIEHPYRILEGGFLISYTSILAIGMVLPFVQEMIKRKETREWKEEGIFSVRGMKRKIRDGMISSSVIYAVTLPVIMQFFFEATPYCIVLNPLILPFMSILMISAIAVGITGSILQLFIRNISQYLMARIGISVLGFPASFILEGYDRIFRFARKLPGSLLITGCPGVGTVVLIYLLEVSLLFLIYKEQYKKIVIMMSIAFFFVLIRPVRPFQITMLDIGQGDCILIQSPEGNILIDGGSTSKKDIFRYVIKPALYYYGISHLDLIIVSHMDEDHISGIREMLEYGYPVDLMLTDDGVFEKNADSYPSLKQIRKIQRGDLVKMGRLKMECLHPSKNFVSEDENAKSVVMYMEYDKFTALFTGDLGMEQEDEILNKANRGELTLLKVGHHGSKYSTGEELLNYYQPQYAILSAGRNNRYHHPHKETLQRLEKAGVQTFQTKEEGAILVRWQKGGVHTKYF